MLYDQNKQNIFLRNWLKLFLSHFISNVATENSNKTIWSLSFQIFWLGSYQSCYVGDWFCTFYRSCIGHFSLWPTTFFFGNIEKDTFVCLNLWICLWVCEKVNAMYANSLLLLLLYDIEIFFRNMMFLSLKKKTISVINNFTGAVRPILFKMFVNDFFGGYNDSYS